MLQVLHHLPQVALFFKKGTQVFLEYDAAYDAINEAGQKEEDVSVFSPERWSNPETNPYKHIPFATGPRGCVGQFIARNILKEYVYSLCKAGVEDKSKSDNNQKLLSLRFFHPAQGSQCSGRHNDHSCQDEDTTWVAWVILRTLVASARVGLGLD